MRTSVALFLALFAVVALPRTSAAAASTATAARDQASTKLKDQAAKRKRADLEEILVDSLSKVISHKHGRTVLSKQDLKKAERRSADFERKLRAEPHSLTDADIARIRRAANRQSSNGHTTKDDYERYLANAHSKLVSHEYGRIKLSKEEVERLEKKKRGYEHKLIHVHGHSAEDIKKVHRIGNRKSAADYTDRKSEL